MDEKKKLVLIILGGAVALLFVFTNFCRPLIADTALRVEEYKKLKVEVKVMSETDAREIASTQEKLKTAVSHLEEKFSSKEKLKFVQQLTNSVKDLDIEFVDIAHKEPKKQQNYKEFPADVTMKASFNNLLPYLLNVEQNPLMIGINSLKLRKNQLQSPILDIKATFFSLELLLEPEGTAAYMEEKYTPVNNKRLEALLEPLPKLDNQSVVSKLDGHDPFMSDYDLAKAESMPQSELEPVIGQFDIRDLFLQGILNVQDKKAALVNDIVVMEGEMIEGAEVVEIQDYKVILRHLDKDYILTMGAENVFTQ